MNVKNTKILIDCLLIAGFCCFAYAPFEKKRIRARWAKSIFAISAIIGIAKGVFGLARDSGWLVLGSETGRRLEGWLGMVSGLLLGFIFSLILSGQLSGTKRVVKEPDTLQDSN